MKKFLITITVITIALLSCKKNNDKAPPTAPLVKTGALTKVADSTVTAGGSIVSDNGAIVTKSGVVWSKTNTTPTLTDSVVAATATTGAFTVNISGLDFSNTYYVRAFATNSVGTGYGDVVAIGAGSDTSKVRFTYNGQEVAYGIIVSPVTGKKWLDRNLGAQQVATVKNDYKAYGDLFQWGRPADGHQLINWTSSTEGTPVNGTTTTMPTSDIPGNSNFIIAPYALPLDWRSDNNRNRWATSPQGPCPAGWHVPRLAEWLAEYTQIDGSNNQPLPGTAPSGGIKNANTAFSNLKLMMAGYRHEQSDGTVIISSIGRLAFYWASSDVSGAEGQFSPADVIKGDGFSFFDDGNFGGASRDFEWKSQAQSVRCIKD